MSLFKFRGNIVQVKEGGLLLMKLLKCPCVREVEVYGELSFSANSMYSLL